MPGGDRSGPRGMGPMTGRAAGVCAGYPGPGSFNPIRGRGYGMGRGGGWGRGWRGQGFAYGPAWGAPRWGYEPVAVPADEAEWLRTQANALQQQLDAINSRLDEIEPEE